MSREVRMVPKKWKHPKIHKRYIPLLEGRNNAFQKRLTEYLSDEEDDYEPKQENYMPNWKDEECTHYMMYESISEGTPMSPAFKTREKLAKWLTDNNANAGAFSTATYDQWLAMIKQKYACSAVICNGKMMSGVEAITECKG